MVCSAKILVVDDEPVVCCSCRELLAEDGHEVSMAHTGAEALQKIEGQRFDVVLLDLRIPGFGGLSLLRAIRKASPDTQVVVITGYPSIENAKESIRLGAFEFVTKPFVPQMLSHLIAQVLSCKPWTIQQIPQGGRAASQNELPLGRLRPAPVGRSPS